MTTRTRKTILAALLPLLAAAVLAAEPPAPGSGVALPPYKTLTLKNGMTVLLMEQHKVPLVSLSYIVRAGSVADPAGKEGLASVTASLLRKGTRTRTADQISEALDFVGATYGASAGVDFSSGRAEFVKKDLASRLDLFADLIMSPVFPEAEVKKLLAQRIDGLKAAKDSAQGVISTYYNAFLFGSHPYGRPSGGDEKSLAAIGRDDIARFHASNYVPSNVILAVAGDFAAADMEEALKARFGAWSSKEKAAQVQVAAAKPVSGKRLLLVDKPDATQTNFMIGNVGVARNDPDRVAIDVVNTLFGGRFTSMINTALRIKNGLTYGASADFEMRRLPGPFFISSYTRTASTEQAIDMTLDVLHQLHEKGITEEDLASAKAYMKGTLPPQMLETSDQLASLLAQLRYYGLPDGEINDFYAKVDAVTLADAKRVIASRYPEKDLAFVLIGKASEIETTAKKYAPEVKRKAISEAGF
jgi:predicted Zn-dependent peptidase